MNTERIPNPTLQAWLDEYRSIADEYVDAVRATGVVFGEPFAYKQQTDALLESLRSKGALFRNGCASIVSGPISEACVACSSSMDDKTFLFSVKCHRNCYFCFNPNQADYDRLLHEDSDWRAEMADLANEGRQMTHIGLTGGEPLLKPEETRAFFEEARHLWPAVHTRLYTTGDQLDATMLESLVKAGMNEIRFSIKPDDSPASLKRTMDIMRMACSYAKALRQEHGDSEEVDAHCEQRPHTLDVMVEMPVIPGSFEYMRALLDELENMGAFGINLLEFCYPFNNWHEFEARGFSVKNPPYPIVYDYEYAGSLPIDGSEVECLRLVEYAIDAKLNLGVHYCSLENKHRSQIHSQNHSAKISHPCHKLDADDFFFKTIKVFGSDVAPVRSFLEATVKGPALMLGGKSWSYDAEDDCLQFHPRHLQAVRAADLKTAEGCGITPVTSVNVLEWHGGNVVLRELDLQLIP